MSSKSNDQGRAYEFVCLLSLNAAGYCIPQNRFRIFIVGFIEELNGVLFYNQIAVYGGMQIEENISNEIRLLNL